MRQTATLEGEAIVRNGIKADRGWHLTFILENDGHDAVLSDASFTEAKSGGSICFGFGWLLNLQSW